MRKRQSAETNMPSPEKHINTISMPAQQIPGSLDSPLCSIRTSFKSLTCHDCSADLVVDIGPVVGICLAPPAAHVLAIHVAAQAAATVMTFQARPADLLSPAQAQVTKRLRVSSKQDIKNVGDMAEVGRATHHKDALHRAERMGLSFEHGALKRRALDNRKHREALPGCFSLTGETQCPHAQRFSSK